MSDENTDDQQSKTQEPTERRLEKAFEEGNIAFSREILHWTVLATSGCLLLWLFPYYTRTFLGHFRRILESCGDAQFSNTQSSIYADMLKLFIESSVYLLIIVVFALAVGLSQTRLNITLQKIAPKLQNISLMKGVSKIFGKQAFVEFMKNLLKITIVGCVMVWTLTDVKTYIFAMPTLSLSAGFDLMKSLFSSLFISALSILALIALLDYIYQRFSHLQRLKMSHKDIKDEIKEQEVSQEVKGKMKQLRLERMRSRLNESVKGSTVVITNPTHYAVALLWNEETMETPRVVAKGTEHLALRMRKIAQENNVPIVENPPLARSLYEKIDIDRDIEAEHYKAVAEVIKYVTDMQNKRFK
ncbi:MAG: EscU/YscU/HrcU family type III secretion system export apparatus switch protein [Alphaproteobacteria bacterium]|nr:EscU/YscU/HrcU family type III secretion system export apparatus switch protein [Alphaproteobacteria bacterium]